MENKEKGSITLKIPPALFWSIFSSIVVGAFFLGLYIGRSTFDREKSDIYEQNKYFKSQVEKLTYKLDSIKASKIQVSQTMQDIFVNGRLSQGLNMGVNTSSGMTNWVNSSNNVLIMTYPENQAWGAVFITSGKPSPPPPPARAAKDFSNFTRLCLELKGEIGKTVSIGLKDNLDADDGSESTYSITFQSEGWNTYEINLLENFQSADLNKLYIVTEFVFGSQAQILHVRKIQFK